MTTSRSVIGSCFLGTALIDPKARGLRGCSGGGLGYYGAGGRPGSPCVVGRHVVDGVSGDRARIYLDRIDKCAIEEGTDAEIEIGLRASDGRAEVGVWIADVNRRWGVSD